MNQTIAKAFLIICLIDIAFSTEKRQIDIYIESMCPDSMNTIVNSVAPAISKGVLELVDIKLHAYGNEKTVKDKNNNYIFTCQNGPAECVGNQIHNCIYDLVKDDATKIMMAACLFQHAKGNGEPFYLSLNTCSNIFSVDQIKIFTCSISPVGINLTVKAGMETPAHTFVPWVVVDGKVNKKDQDEINKDLYTWAHNQAHTHKIRKFMLLDN